ncbi:MAG: 16S rRNA methyltransferase [Candidatus Heimdallarchaeaceae archaeon]
MARFVTILLAQASLEPFPKELLKYLEARKYFQKIKKKPEEVVLDFNYHSNFMKNLPCAEKRGRPDIVHFALLACFGSIIAKEQRLRVIIHTYNNKVIKINPQIRLPKNLDRFNGIILQLFKYGKVPKDAKEPLMTLEESLSLEELIRQLKAEHDLVLEFSVEGRNMSSREYTEILYNKAVSPLLIFGAFPHGHLDIRDSDLIDYKIAIYNEGLDLFSVIAHILASLHIREENN